MRVKIMNSPYYDNVLLHPVGRIIEVSDDFDFGRQGNFGRVNDDGSISVPMVKRPEAESAPKPKVEYDWQDGGTTSEEAPIFPDGAGVKISTPAGLTSPGGPARTPGSES